MKKIIVFILMPLLVFMLFLSSVSESAPQETSLPTTDVHTITRRFEIRRASPTPGKDYVSMRNRWYRWSEYFRGIQGRVVRVVATWKDSGFLDRDEKGSVEDIVVNNRGNREVVVHGFARTWRGHPRTLFVVLRIDYLRNSLEFPQFSADVSGDGVVNVQDLVFVANHFGPSTKKYHPQSAQNTFIYESSRADVNTDGVVNIQDLVLVAGAIGESAAAPSIQVATSEMLTAPDVQLWLRQAQTLQMSDAQTSRGIVMLEQLLAALTPKKTALLANYPNPFNPETWIPYHLAESADVTLTIYSAEGRLVRTLALGHQPAGLYESKSRAAYWDGRNSLGERVASGLYFYTLTAGDFAATGKMLILK